MAIAASLQQTRSFYFDVVTQQLSQEKSQGPCVMISIPESTRISEPLLASLKKLGNQFALWHIAFLSFDTRNNYCDDYRQHAGTCEQKDWQLCRRHLGAAENEARELEKRYDPHTDGNLKGVKYQLNWAKPIKRGEIDTMKLVFESAKRGMLAL